MQLRMDSQAARIGININDPVFNLKISEPQIDIETKASRLEIKNQKTIILIDQSECFADEGHRNIEDFLQYWVNYSLREYRRGISRTVAEGNRLAAIHTGYSIPDMARDEMYEKKEFNIVAIPNQPPRIDTVVEQGSYNYTPSDLQVRARMGDVKNDYQQGKVEIYIAQQNSLNIQWINDNQVDLLV